MWYKNGKIFESHLSIREDNQDVSLPSILTDAFLEGMGYLKVIDRPSPAKEYENASCDGVELINNIPYLKWKVEQKTQEEIVQLFKHKIQEVLDLKAQSKGYDNIVSACSYAGYVNSFQAEGESFGIWRANVWSYGYSQLALIESGQRTLPTVEAFIAELPVFAG